MAGITLEKGKRIYDSGQPMTAFHLITKGKVQVDYPGGTYQLGKGEVIGVCELCSEVHFLGYTALEDTIILTYRFNGMEALDELLQKHPDVARLFLLSLFHQINMLLELSFSSEMSCTSLHQNLMGDYAKYNSLCSRYHIQPQILEGLAEISAYLGGDSADMWLNSYYLGLQHIYSGTGADSKSFMLEPGVSLGMLRKGSLDFRRTFTVLEEQLNYRSGIAGYYFNPSGNDLFELFTALYNRLGQNNEDSAELLGDIERIISQFENDPSVNKARVTARIGAFRSSLSPKDASGQEAASGDAADAAVMKELTGSLDAILGFTDFDAEKGNSFREHVEAYKALEDKTSMEDFAVRLRRQLTEEFYALYTSIFKTAVEAPRIPVPVKMFLYFGYVDEDLAGAANCATLYNLACGMEDQSSLGVYTLYHWLLAILRGDKSPSRNEFDEDYTDYLHKQKAGHHITAAQFTELEKDPMSKVAFEMQNMFPQVNKMTCGRVTTFCPLFSADNVMKDLKSAFVTTTQVHRALEKIKAIDYSAFYRESMDYDNMEIMGKETIHVEFLPDIILMPNVGIRGVMWQEIEGKKRNSPGRMFFSIFHMEDISTTMVRLTGEFRWEMCKRIQSSRWNDVSERSLTSEYFDYIQFYRKNQELSTEAKERLRNSLQRAKNSFKEMFVRDYIMWILFEGTGSPRLNKVARRILLTYCPFPAELAASMEQNPTYTEIMSRQKVLRGQRLHHLNMLRQKFRNSGVGVPDTLEAEVAFTEGKV
ncbi:MAG: hypothetical protein NC517_07240 [Firmicutes bacterium]|nr:hypothetical protein [Bacillota bacterium]